MSNCSNCQSYACVINCGLISPTVGINLYTKQPSWEIVSSKCQPETYLKESILELWKLHSNFSKQKNHWEVRSTKVIIKLFLWKLQVPWVGDLVCGYNGILHASWGEGSLLVILSKCYIVVLFKLEIELASLLQTGPRYKCKKKLLAWCFVTSRVFIEGYHKRLC